MFSFLQKKKKKIYLDYASTTPVLPEVLLAMEPYWDKQFQNASSLYLTGVESKRAIESARSIVAESIGSQPRGIVFTGSGTEANNMAVLGLRNEKGRFDGMHLLTTVIEHPSIIESFKEAERLGAEVTFVGVNPEGIIDTRELSESITERTRLVSVMMVNNEIGTIQPIKEVAHHVRKAQKKFGTEILLHTDASQAPNYIEIDAIKLGVDMLTLDASKIYGPKGIGCLYVGARVSLQPIMFGGGQEKGLRSATEPAALIVGFAKALGVAVRDRDNEAIRLNKIRDYAIRKILKDFPKATLNGSAAERIPNNINICFPGIDSEYAVIQLDQAGIECSYASSCKSLGDDLSSYVVNALGKEGCGASSLRFSLGRGSKKSDIDILIKKLKKIVK